MKKLACLTLFAALAAPQALAASAEADYLAARDKAIAKIKSMEKAKVSDDKIAKEDAALRADLEKRLKSIIGEVSIKGYPKNGKFTYDSLSTEGVGFSGVDGLVYAENDEAPQVIVTTTPLLDAYILAKSKEKDAVFRLPADRDAALGRNNFYSYGIGSDAVFTKSADLPVSKPDGVDFVSARLGGWAQDIGPNPNAVIIVTLGKDGKAFFASESAKAKTTEIPVCEALWKKEGGKAEESGDMKAQDRAHDKYYDCLIAQSPKEMFYPAMVKQAQDIVDRLAGK